MGAEDWYRNTTWSDEIAAAFSARLRRSRKWNVAQYLRIQASYLERKHPTVALELIAEFFKLDSEQIQIDSASAHLVRANACIALEDIPSALHAFESAIQRENEFPNVQTSAWSEYAEFVVLNRVTSLYPRILALLDERRGSCLFLFPAHTFTWNAAKALILAEIGSNIDALELAKAALASAGKQNSGLTYHSQIGLVDQKDPLLVRLKDLILKIS